MVKRKYQICNCCVMDTTDEYITFDENGVSMTRFIMSLV